MRSWGYPGYHLVRYRVMAGYVEPIPLCILALIPNALCIYVDITLTVPYSDPSGHNNQPYCGRYAAEGLVRMNYEGS